MYECRKKTKRKKGVREVLRLWELAERGMERSDKEERDETEAREG